jgi:4-amino-4-deoxy-L-arabinose transferase-like glycosyltransferase
LLPEPKATHLSDRAAGIAFVLIAILWLSARAWFFNGYYTEDAPGYVGDAVAIATGTYAPRNHVNGLNVGTYAPVAIPLLVLGKTDVALSVWPLLCSLLGVASMAGSAAILFGRPFGAIAALLYATYPGDVFFSTVVMPDSIQAGWLSASMWLVVHASTETGRRASRWLVAAGAAMGICHLIRANGALLLPIGVCGVVFFRRGCREQPRRDIAVSTGTFLAGWLGVLLAEGFVYYITVGDFLFRFHVVSGHYGTVASIAQYGLNTHPLTIPWSAWAPLMWMHWGGWGTFNQDQAYHGLIFTWAVAALALDGAALAFSRRARSGKTVAAFVVAGFWLAWPLLYHQLGSQSLTQFVPIHRLSRHLVVYAPGAIIAVVVGIAIVWQAASGTLVRWGLAIVASGLFVLHSFLNFQAEIISYAAYHQIKDTYVRIRDHLPPETRTIVADPGDLGYFDFWLNPLGQQRVTLMPFAAYASCADLPRGVVLTYSNPGWSGLSAPVIQETVARLPCLVSPPPRWRLLYAGYPERIYVIP